MAQLSAVEKSRMNVRMPFAIESAEKKIAEVMSPSDEMLRSSGERKPVESESLRRQVARSLMRVGL